MEENQMIKKPIQNFLGFAIVATFFGCCSFLGVGFILGVVAIVFAVMSNNKYKTGDYEGAQKSLKISKAFTLASALAFVFTVAYGIYDYSANSEFYKEQVEQIMQEYQKAQQEAQNQ